jgi:hypothetical protein
LGHFFHGKSFVWVEIIFSGSIFGEISVLLVSLWQRAGKVGHLLSHLLV